MEMWDFRREIVSSCELDSWSMFVTSQPVCCFKSTNTCAKLLRHTIMGYKVYV